MPSFFDSSILSKKRDSRPIGDIYSNLCTDLFWNSFKEGEAKGMIVSYTPSNKTEAKAVLEEHRMILEQIKKRDPEKAADYMFKHFRALALNKDEDKER